MKKIILAVMAVAAISFTSCGNKTQQAAEAVDSVAIVDSLAGEAANSSISALAEQLEAGDANKFQEVLTTVKEKIASLIKENPEIAKEYVVKVQNFLKENADKVKALVGENAAVAAAVSAITDADASSMINGLLENVEDAATAAKDSAAAAVSEKAEEVKDAAKEKANEAIDNAASAAKEKLGL